MTDPCRTDCPQGDCAGCAFPPCMTSCAPSRPCPQAGRCARQAAIPDDDDVVIDGTALRVGKFCPLFIDARHPALELA